jgi:hypothetical protein
MRLLPSHLVRGVQGVIPQSEGSDRCLFIDTGSTGNKRQREDRCDEEAPMHEPSNMCRSSAFHLALRSDAAPGRHRAE